MPASQPQGDSGRRKRAGRKSAGKSAPKQQPSPAPPAFNLQALQAPEVAPYLNAQSRTELFHSLQRSLGNAHLQRTMKGVSSPGPAPESAAPIQRWTMPYLTLKNDAELLQDGLNGVWRAQAAQVTPEAPRPLPPA